MTSVVGRLRNFSKGLVSSDDNKGDGNDNNNINNSSNGTSILNRPGNFLSKFGASNNQSKPHAKRYKTLLVIDSKDNYWSSVFDSKDVSHISYGIKVEQAEFHDLTIVSSSERGVTASIYSHKNGVQVARSFQPDFVLICQYVNEATERERRRNLLLGLIHGRLPSMNPLWSTYNFIEKAVVYSELTCIKERLGVDAFPLIEQTYYQSAREMTIPPALPVVVKSGSDHSGVGKVCVATARGFQDVVSLLTMSSAYATAEPFLDSKFDVRIMKIGGIYKVYKRRSLSESWKANMGSSVVEEIALTERYKLWVDECSKLFGGLEFVCVEVVHTKSDKEYIVEVNDTLRVLCQHLKTDQMGLIANAIVKKIEDTYPIQAKAEVKTPTAAALYEAMAVAKGSSIRGSVSSDFSTRKVSAPAVNRISTSTPVSPLINKRMGNGYQGPNTAPLKGTTQQTQDRRSSMSLGIF